MNERRLMIDGKQGVSRIVENTRDGTKSKIPEHLYRSPDISLMHQNIEILVEAEGQITIHQCRKCRPFDGDCIDPATFELANDQNKLPSEL